MTLTHAQAVSQVEHLVNETVAVLTPRPQLQLDQLGSRDQNCSNAAGEMSNSVNVGRAYVLGGISAADNPALGEAVKSFWQKQGYKITQSGGIGTDQPNINATTGDDYLVALQSNSEGVLRLVASSPCAQPTG